MVTIDAHDDCYILEGDLEIFTNSRLKSNLKSIGSEYTESSVIVKFDNNSSEKSALKVYELIQKILAKFSIESSKSSSSNEVIDEVLSEIESFREFSLKAENIRNNIHKEDDFENFVKILDKSLVRPLYKLQILAAYHLAFAQNACNFSVPGTGKTSIVYGAYSYLKSLGGNSKKYVDRILIISPLSAFDAWESEFIECFGYEPSINKLVNISPEARRSYYFSEKYTEVSLISYQSASNEQDVEGLISFLKRNKVMVILDEAHRIKNVNKGVKAKWANAILQLAEYASSRVVLTGTPSPQGYEDLYNLYKFIWPSRDIISFPLYRLKELSKPSTHQSIRQDVKKLVSDISPFFIRITKKDLPGMPLPIEHKPIVVMMDQHQRTIYDYIENLYLGRYQIDEDEINTGDEFLDKLRKAKLIRLLQCATNPSLLLSSIDSHYDVLEHDLGIEDKDIINQIQTYSNREITPPKFEAIRELISTKILPLEGPDSKVIIWSVFIKNILDLQKYLDANGISSKLLYGDVPQVKDINRPEIETRYEIIKEFHNHNSNFKVIIANPFAVGESISLHKACRNAVYLDKNFNAATFIQSKDRIHRYGLNNNDKVNYYYFLSEDSIDYKVHDVILEKQQRMLDVIESEEIPLINLNMDEDSISRNFINELIHDYHARKASKI